MNFLVQLILPYILLYKYVALFLITFFASIALPVPAGTLLVASSAFASQGYFNIYIVILVAMLASILGDNVCYWLTYFFGLKVMYFLGFKKILDSKDFNIVEKRIREKPGFVVFISRFDVITSLLVNFISGVSKMSYKKYMLFEAAGTLVSTLFYALAGYLFGDSWQVVNNLIGNFSIIFFLSIALLLFLFWKRIVRGAKPKN